MSNLLLASFQKKIGKKLGIKPGEEMLRAVKAAGEVGASLVPADRDIRTTLSRAWRLMGFWKKIKLLTQLVLSMGETDSLTEKDIEGNVDRPFRLYGQREGGVVEVVIGVLVVDLLGFAPEGKIDHLDALRRKVGP